MAWRLLFQFRRYIVRSRYPNFAARLVLATDVNLHTEWLLRTCLNGMAVSQAHPVLSFCFHATKLEQLPVACQSTNRFASTAIDHHTAFDGYIFRPRRSQFTQSGIMSIHHKKLKLTMGNLSRLYRGSRHQCHPDNVQHGSGFQ